MRRKGDKLRTYLCSCSRAERRDCSVVHELRRGRIARRGAGLVSGYGRVPSQSLALGIELVPRSKRACAKLPQALSMSGRQHVRCGRVAKSYFALQELASPKERLAGNDCSSEPCVTSGRLDSNQRPPEPHSGALAKLRHAPSSTPLWELSSLLPRGTKHCQGLTLRRRTGARAFS